MLLFPCKASQFRCDNGWCIPSKKKHDGADDCGDNSDEVVVEVSPNKTCSEEEFSCLSSGLCIPQTWLCDEVTDCDDLSDEAACPPQVCSPSEFRCSSQRQCTDPDYQCDGYRDCQDGSDEAACPPLVCSHSQINCDIERKCLDLSLRCNGYRDCGDGSDEVDCYPDTLTVTSTGGTSEKWPSFLGLYKRTNMNHSGRPVWQTTSNDERFLFYNGNNHILMIK